MGLKINKKISLIPKIIGWVLVAVLVFMMGKILIWENSYYRDKGASERAEAIPVITNVARVPYPHETEPSAESVEAYQVEADLPRYLDIPRLDVHARVYRSEVDKQILPVPDNIYNAMWYAGSARPGQRRNVLISGLAKGETKDGIFANLTSLENGDKITIISGNDFKYHYEVAETRIIETANLTKELCLAQKPLDGEETLSLITVLEGSNATDSNAETYSNVAIIRAKLVSTDEVKQ